MDMKKMLVNEYYALLYQFLIVPILAGSSLLFYYHFIILRMNEINFAVTLIVTAVLIALNVLIIYGIACLVKKIFKMPMINYIVTGVVTMVILGFTNAYFYNATNMFCVESMESAIKCKNNIGNSKFAMTALIVVATYFFLYIIIQTIVNKQTELKKKKVM